MKKKQLIVLFIFIGINLILLLLIYRINNYNRILIDELVQKKVDEKLTLSFFKENHELNNSDFLKMIKENILQLSISDSTFIIFISSQSCNACCVDLFATLKENKISADQLYLITESPDQLLKRDWKTFGFKNFDHKKLSLFDHFPEKEHIVIAKFINKYRPVSCLVYKPEYSQLVHEIFTGFKF